MANISGERTGIFCAGSASIATMLLFAFFVIIDGVDAFRTPSSPDQTASRIVRTPPRCDETLNNNDARSESDRRYFLTKSMTAQAPAVALVLCSFGASMMLPTDAALALERETVLPLSSGDRSSVATTTTTTPSISEGELTASVPPPNRASVQVLPTHPSSDDANAKREGTTTNRNAAPAAYDPRFFIAGGASAAISHGITTPLDVVKTRMQSDVALASSSPSDAAIRIVEREGAIALTAGLGPTVIGYGIEGALKFGAYESLKPVFLSLFAQGASAPNSGSGGAYLSAAVCAGALASVILCPMEETRIRLVTDPTFGDGLLDGLPKLLREEGALSPFKRGLPAMLSKQVPYTIGKQVSFDVFSGMLYTFLVGLSFVPQRGIALEVEVGAAFLASIVACLASHPGDVLLTATYKDAGDDESTTNSGAGFGATVKKVYNDGGGIQAFLRGLNARFLHVGCIITFQLVIYDQLKQVLGLPASGS
mmetsp:Transcript_6722/g.16556  ORF Transcript_6722/g.16556 Transcript_6722/m.16556 type:complete len:482 (-) Transcript_6722:266-1711(-)